MSKSPRGREEVAVAVVGGGLLGRATAWQLARRGVDVMLLEARTWAHTEGSSHGAGRVFRTTYMDSDFIHLCKEGLADWRALEAEADEVLVRPDPACFFGPREGPWARFAEAVAQADTAAELPSPGEARELFPWIRLHDGDAVLIDHTAGVIQAARTLEALRTGSLAHGARMGQGRPVQGLERTPSGWRLDTHMGPVFAEQVVLAAGPWNGQLLPQLAPFLRVVPQTVALLPQVPRLPIWAWLGTGDEEEVEADFFYGLENGPERAHKVAAHHTRGAHLDPDGPRPEADAWDALAFWRWRMTLDPGPVQTERCLYTCTATEDFILDAVPGESGLFVGAGLSGHGFKFGPVLGRVLADQVMGGAPSVASLAQAGRRWGFPTA